MSVQPNLNMACGTAATVSEQPTSSLSLGGQLLVWSLRHGTMTARYQIDGTATAEHVYKSLGCPDAVPLLDVWIGLLPKVAYRPVLIRRVCFPTLGEDEYAILQCMRALQHADQRRALGALSQILAGPFSTSFCDAASAYVKAVTSAGLSFTGVDALRSVDQLRRTTL